jgi:uncharacterized protein (DUF1697 family)
MARTRYVAFLRAINVGGHNCTMADLKKPFERLGLDDVDTFIASGNVIFSTNARSMAPLEKRIEAALKDELGYDVATFIRREDEVAAVARYRPFAEADMRAALSLNVGFVTAEIAPATRSALMALATESDTFHANGREIYWMARTRQSDSKISNVYLERALKIRSTFRGLKTIVRLADKLGSAS